VLLGTMVWQALRVTVGPQQGYAAIVGFNSNTSRSAGYLAPAP
jgi:hypothetical protein